MNFNERTTALLQAPPSPLVWDSTLRECTSIEADNPYIPSGFLWVTQYKRYEVEKARGNPSVALKYLRKAISLVPYSDNLQEEYLRHCNKEAPVEYMAMVVTSRDNQEQALQLAHYLDTAQLEYILVSGGDGERIHHPRAVRVDVPDNYENLGRKTIAGLTWIYENISPKVSVLKLSDDMLIENPVALSNAMQRWKAQDAYAGLPMLMGNDHDRCRHWGRCEDPQLNRLAYARPYYRPWATSDAIFLAPGPLGKLVMSMIRFPAQADGEYFEDKLIGDVLMFEGVGLTPLAEYADAGLVRRPGAGQDEDDGARSGFDNDRFVNLLQEEATPMISEYVLDEIDRIGAESTHIPSHIKWTLPYKAFQIEGNRGNLQAACRHLKDAIALAPFNPELLEDYRNFFINKSAPYHDIALLISCKKYESKALQLAAQFEQAGIQYLIVTGNDTAPINHERALQVDAPDNYESLPRKVAAACAWVVENLGGNVGVLKVDDDQFLQDSMRLKAILESLHQRDAYAGVPVSGVTHDRNWHWNKCQNKALHEISYGRPFLRQWAMGGAYYLAPGPLYKLVLTLTRFPGLLESEYYEDKMVGDTLIFENVDLLPLTAYEDFGLTLTEFHRFNKE